MCKHFIVRYRVCAQYINRAMDDELSLQLPTLTQTVHTVEHRKVGVLVNMTVGSIAQKKVVMCVPFLCSINQ